MTEDEMLAALRLLPGTTVVTASEEAGAGGLVGGQLRYL